MFRLIVEGILMIGSFAGGWYCCRKFGAKVDAVVKDVIDP